MIRNPVADAMASAGYRSIGIWRALDVDAEVRALAIRRRVSVRPLKLATAPDGTKLAGRHCETIDGIHIVYLSVYLAPDVALEVLRHELCHARQSETVPDFQAAYDAETGAVGYQDNRFEIEARDHAARSKAST